MPTGGQCMNQKIIYQATLNSKWGKIEDYVDLTANTFKERFSGHLFNFNHKNSKGTTLSAHIWKLKNENKQYDKSWKILQRTKPFTPKMDNVHFARHRKQARQGRRSSGLKHF